MKKYIKPKISVVELRQREILCSSYRDINDSYLMTCNRNCRLWHTCRDRDHGKFCRDKKW